MESFYSLEYTINIGDEGIQRCNKTITFTQCRDMVNEEEGRGYSTESGDEDGEMDSWYLTAGNEKKSEDIRRICGVRNIKEKARKARLTYLRHGKRREMRNNQ